MKTWKWAVPALLILICLGGLALSDRRLVDAAQGPESTKGTGPAADKPIPAQKQRFPSLRAEEQALRKTIQSLCDAFNKADLDALVASWAPDAEYIDEAGRTYRSREAIRILLRKSLVHYKGSKQSIKVGSMRFFKPDVVSEEGTVTMTSSDGAVELSRYTALWIKQGGKWLISCVRDLPDRKEEGPVAHTKLNQLAWMVGQWQDKDGKEVRMTCKWGPNQTFLIQEFIAKHADGKEHTATQWIGWDAYNEHIRSWVFDSSGGFGEGSWTRKGNTWEVQCEGVYPDGRVAKSVNTWKFVNEKSAEWSATDREADEVPLPDLRATFVRKESARIP